MTVAALFVAPESQGRGIGGRFMRHANELRSEMNLTVYKENSGAVRFYDRHDFESLSERIDECTGQVETMTQFPGQNGQGLESCRTCGV
jgi:ribosomal protein S18 acetylase RimI-like enzyme